MSDILIRNMEMPKTCRRCLEMEIPVRCRVKEQEPVTAVMSGYERPSDCPLVEVPPHGDLIDRSLALGACHEMARSLEMEGAFEVIENAPTIIEASKESEKSEKQD